MAGRIMVVDDDRSLLGFTSKYLARLGYPVTACARGDEAWSLFSASPAEFKVAIIDYTLAGVSGAQLARMILEHSPDARLVLTSGLRMDPNALEGLSLDRVLFLQKPFTPAMLVQAIVSLTSNTHAD